MGAPTDFERNRWVVGVVAIVAVAALLILAIMGGFEEPERVLADEMYAQVAPVVGEPFYGREGDTGGWLMDRVADADRAHPEWHVWPQPDQFYSDRTIPGYVERGGNTARHVYAFADGSRFVMEGTPRLLGSMYRGVAVR